MFAKNLARAPMYPRKCVKTNAPAKNGQYPQMCEDPQTGMFMSTSMSLQPSGMLRSVPRYSHARQSQADQTTSQNAPWGTRASFAFSYNSFSRVITSLSCSFFFFAIARVEFSIKLCRLADSMSMNGSNASMLVNIRRVWNSTTARWPARSHRRRPLWGKLRTG